MTYRSYPATRTVLSTATDTAITVRGDAGSAPGDPQTMLATVDFGDGPPSDSATTTVVDFTWKRDASTGDVPRPTCTVVGRPDVEGLLDDEALILGIRALVTDIVDGVSFVVKAFAPAGATGLFEVHIRGE